MTCGLVLYVCLGTPAGYVSARVYKSTFFSWLLILSFLPTTCNTLALMANIVD